MKASSRGDALMLNILIDYPNSAADRWAAWLLAASLDAALLPGLIALVWGAIRNRVAPQVGYLLFLLVPLKLLVPVVVTIPAELGRWTPSALIERVIPGRATSNRSSPGFSSDQGAIEVTSSCEIPATFPAGQAVHIDLGGTGRAVVGKPQPPEGFTGMVRWNWALVHVRSDEKTERDDGPSMQATVDHDGKFRIDNAPAGHYSLSVSGMRYGEGRFDNHRFAVPPTKEGTPAEPVDLGTLKAQKP